DAIQFNILRQNVDTAKSLYNDFLQKTNQVNLQRADQAKDMRVIDPAQTPTEPVGPNRVRSILLGFLLSLVGGIGLALGIEYLDNTIKSIEDVQRVAQLPTLAVIPMMNQSVLRAGKAKRKAIQGESGRTAAQRGAGGTVVTSLAGIVPRGLQSKGGRLAALDALSAVVEAYRMLRTAVLLSTAGKPPKTIQVTSSQPGEGKTTTAINMAVSMSQLGARVLLIDADLRRPTVHKTFKLPQMRGLSSFLSSNGEIDEFIVKLPSSNLSVMTAGPIPPNPAELIGSDRMRDLLRQLDQHFDHVIIDSPPLISVTDPVVLSTLVDGTILVVQAGRTTKDLIRRARLELSGVGAKIFGVVLNNVNIRREGYDEYYYHRYYSNYYTRKES
ncbi:MAG: polysaccharide biosynthesis tyrosine autokinase, partial [Blastocatellia bacterium]